MPRVFVSDAVGAERLAVGPQPKQLARGWKALSALYQASLAACGIETVQLLRPEIYQTDQARAVLGVAAGDWHLAVKPIEHLRPFHGIPNVFVCDWAFPELSGSALGDSPFFDQVRLLRQADAVLCCTDFTTRTLHAAGVERAFTMPPRIAAHPGRADRHGQPSRLLCVVELDQLARQLGPAIEGVAQAAARHGGLHLTVCLQGGGEPDMDAVRQRLDPGAAVSVVSDAALPGLLDAADIVLSCHAAAGLFLPLVDAALAGVPLVTTMGAGTGSYLPPDAAVPIATEPDLLDGVGEPIGRFMPLTSNPPTAAAVRDAILMAVALDGATRARMVQTARAAAERHFGLTAFQTGLARLAGLLAQERP